MVKLFNGWGLSNLRERQNFNCFTRYMIITLGEHMLDIRVTACLPGNDMCFRLAFNLKHIDILYYKRSLTRFIVIE